MTGLWELEKIEKQDTLTNEWKEAEWMKGGAGILHYDEVGNMSVHFVSEGYFNQEYDEVEERSGESRSNYWYVGTYKVLEEQNTVEHTRLLHSNPKENNKTVKREYVIDNDTLFLFASEYGFRLKWLRQTPKRQLNK